jgi:probable rRNA maturation factor
MPTRVPAIELTLHLALIAVRSGVPSKISLQSFASAALAAALRAEPARAKALSTHVNIGMQVVDAETARATNHDFRNKDYATNVLSFPFEAPPGVKNFRLDYLGDLMLCAPVLAREAKEQGKSLRAHYAHMCVHGVLHLLGYDHLRARDAKHMETLETAILEDLGFSDPYQSEQVLKQRSGSTKQRIPKTKS